MTPAAPAAPLETRHRPTLGCFPDAFPGAHARGAAFPKGALGPGPAAPPLRRRLLPLSPRPRRRRRPGGGVVRERAPAHLGRAQPPHLRRAQHPGLDVEQGVADRLLLVDVHQLALRDHCEHADLPVPVAERILLLRPQHVHGVDGDRPHRLRRLPGRAAALLPRVGLPGLGRRLHRRAAGQRRLERPVQPIRRGAVDARGVRADDRVVHGPPRASPGRQGPLVALPVPGHVRRGGHREPLLPRRRPRSAHRRGVLLPGPRAARSCPAQRLGVPRRPGGRHRLMGPDQLERERAPRARRAGRPPTGAELSALMRNRLIESRLTPNAISMTGLVLNVAAAVLVWERWFFLGGVAFIVGSIMDTLDGRYSRMSGKGTPFGAFLDSTLDRIEEGIVLTAVAAYFASRGMDFAVAAVVVAVLSSLMVSYTRARAEALGVECKVGIATRAVRVVILSIGLLFAKGASLGDFELLAPAVYVLAGLSVITVLQRIFHVRSVLNEG